MPIKALAKDLALWADCGKQAFISGAGWVGVSGVKSVTEPIAAVLGAVLLLLTVIWTAFRMMNSYLDCKMKAKQLHDIDKKDGVK